MAKHTQTIRRLTADFKNSTLRNTIVKNFATDLSLTDLMLVIEERKLYSKKSSQTTGRHICCGY